MKRLSIIFIIIFIFACTLHAGRTYYSPEGEPISKQQFEELQREHAKKVKAAREKREAELYVNQTVQKSVYLDKSGRPIPLDSLGRPIKTPDGRRIIYPDQERRDIPQVTIVGHEEVIQPPSNYREDLQEYGYEDGLSGQEKWSDDSDYLAGYRDGQRERDRREEEKRKRNENKGFIDPYSGKFYPPVAGGAIDPETGAFYPKVAGGYIDTKTGKFVPAN